MGKESAHRLCADRQPTDVLRPWLRTPAGPRGECKPFCSVYSYTAQCWSENCMVDKVKVLIVSTSVMWTRALRTYLHSTSRFQLLETARGGLTAYQRVREQRPQLLVVDDSLPQDEAFALISAVKASGEPIYCIALVTTSRYTRAATAAGADAVVLRSGSSRELEAAVDEAQARIIALQSPGNEIH